MTFQPAAGARDLNPQQVERNQVLSERLASVYRVWGYEEVAPPRVERMSTLKAGGGIDSKDIVRLVAGEPLGLRPEMTASIARAACTRLANRPRPLRLWAVGTVFESKESVDGGISIEENLQSGVELFGVHDIAAEMELLSLLLETMEALELKENLGTSLLIGHTSLMNLILKPFCKVQREIVKKALINYDRLTIETLEIDKEVKNILLSVQECRGYPIDVLTDLATLIGEEKIILSLKRLFMTIEPIATEHGVTIQLDPTFQPHFDLYSGIVFQLVCQDNSAPIVIAKGGRYDELMNRLGAEINNQAGVGFSYSIDKLRELIPQNKDNSTSSGSILVAFSSDKRLEDALKRQNELHKRGLRAIVELNHCKKRDEAISLLAKRNCNQLDWVD